MAFHAVSQVERRKPIPPCVWLCSCFVSCKETLDAMRADPCAQLMRYNPRGVRFGAPVQHTLAGSIWLVQQGQEDVLRGDV